MTVLDVCCTSPIASMLAWFLYFTTHFETGSLILLARGTQFEYSAISRLLTILEKKVFKTLAALQSPMIIFSLSVNTHMHKMGPRGPKHYIFGDHFWSKNARKLRFHVSLHFTTRKHMILSFYLKWTEFKRNCEFVPL